MTDDQTPDRIRTLHAEADGVPSHAPRTDDPADGWQALVERMRRRLRRWRVRPEALEPGRWWNGSLRSTSQLEVAAARAAEARLPVSDRHDRTWDSLEALELILGTVDATCRIVDIGLRTYAPLIRWLSLLGFGRLPRDPSVRMRANRLLAGHRGGLEAAGDELLGDGARYDVVTCRSLPGDRVPLTDRLRQADLLLRSGGIFVLSTDFWDLPDPYRGGERRCATDHLCCRRSARTLARRALETGLVPVAPIFLDEPPQERHPDLLGVGASPVKLAFRKRGREERSG